MDAKVFIGKLTLDLSRGLRYDHAAKNRCLKLHHTRTIHLSRCLIRYHTRWHHRRRRGRICAHDVLPGLGAPGTPRPATPRACANDSEADCECGADGCAQVLMATRVRIWCVLVLLAYPFFSVGAGVAVAIFGASALPLYALRLPFAAPHTPAQVRVDR